MPSYISSVVLRGQPLSVFVEGAGGLLRTEVWFSYMIRYVTFDFFFHLPRVHREIGVIETKESLVDQTRQNI